MIILREQRNDGLLSVDEPYFLEVNFKKLLMNFHDAIISISISISIRFPFSEAGGLHRNHDRAETPLDMLREASSKNIYFKRKHPVVQDRINSINRLLCTANGDIKLCVNPNCSGIISSLEQSSYKAGSYAVDKTKGVKYAADALRYYIDYKHPMRKSHVIGISL